MAVVSSDVDVASQALSLLAKSAISALSENATVARTYETYVQGFMGAHTWEFLKTTIQLSKNATPPLVKWRDSYAMPADRIGNPLSLHNNTGQGSPAVVDFETFADAVHCNEDLLYLTYRQRKSEILWPAYFVNFAVIALAARWAIPLTEDDDKAKTLGQDAFGLPAEAGRGGLFRTARQLDSSGAGLNVIEDNTLIAARVGANSGWR